ncbi:pyridoxal phosphate-dependent aminotransferase family protein [Sulfurimonas sp.]|uniref:aminotransferase class I/II-fold pyridoxal phosphate-dependent enzyme n=1 Tax=Sulfurimonas sp. TaxID=2022749 RepID=UPI002602BB72|nr:pyridoxal phosphate-dependent aminotransferase family protein [Sulfurimonas sp.]
MIFYENELKALKRAGRYRTREVVDMRLKDFASNDYLGLAHNKDLHKQACAILQAQPLQSSKASMLVNGYHQIHKEFEDAMCKANGFEAGIVLGSGFNANIALIEALVRRGDVLFMDEFYHASGILASSIGDIAVHFFRHNDMKHLEELLQNSTAKRKIVAVEGIYSMDGDICSKEVFALADNYEAIIIVDEAHSSGVIGKKLMGVFDYYDIEIKNNYIKMGTLGKAYGSFGAFILGSGHIVEYLLNRAKPVIYATSLSLYDTLLAHQSLDFILSNAVELKKEIALRQEIVFDELGIKIDGLIVPISIGENKKVIEIKNALLNDGYGVGAIRQPTVPHAIIRLIARLGESDEALREICKRVAAFRE